MITINKHNIKKYRYEEFPDIIEIIWKAGKLNRSVIEKFPNLQKISCENSNLHTLKQLSNCVNLRELYCENNNIKTLRPLVNCTNLQILNCYNNQIKNLKPLINKINLRELYCGENPIETLIPLRNCINLQKLSCGNTLITDLEPQCCLEKIDTLYYWGNQLKNPPSNLIEKFLRRFSTDPNIFVYDNPNILYLSEADRIKSLMPIKYRNSL